MRPIVLLAVALAACSRDQPRPTTAKTAQGVSVRAPNGDAVPDNELGHSILRGHAILLAPHDSLPEYAPSALRCTSCHLGDGRQPGALPLTGVYARFPQFRSRAAAVQRIEDRINDCFLRSLNGAALKFDDSAMRDIVAYLAFISRGVAVGDVAPAAPEGPTSGDTVAGARVYVVQCARCHLADGTGTGPYPPLWGPQSFNIGAGMARHRTAYMFIRHNMPFDQPGTLNDVDAANVAAYVTSRARPDFAGKERDWPRGDAPADAPYATAAGRKP